MEFKETQPIYLQIADFVCEKIMSKTWSVEQRIPAVRELAVLLEVNPNTVMRAYRELELGGLLETQQGTGTFISDKKPEKKTVERERQLGQMAGEFAARAGAAGFTLEELIDRLRELLPRPAQRR